MAPLTWGDISVMVACIVPSMTVFLTMRRDRHTDAAERDARVMERQMMVDKLDTISDVTHETKVTVDEISRQLNDHTKQLAIIQTQLNEHGRRIEDLEGRIGVGGTD